MSEATSLLRVQRFAVMIHSVSFRGPVSPQPRLRRDNLVADDIAHRAVDFQHFHGRRTEEMTDEFQ